MMMGTYLSFGRFMGLFRPNLLKMKILISFMLLASGQSEGAGNCGKLIDSDRTTFLPLAIGECFLLTGLDNTFVIPADGCLVQTDIRRKNSMGKFIEKNPDFYEKYMKKYVDKRSTEGFVYRVIAREGASPRVICETGKFDNKGNVVKYQN